MIRRRVAAAAAFIFLLLALAAFAIPQGQPGQRYQIIIVGGQSNAVSRAPIVPEWQVNSVGIYQLGRFGDTNLTVIPAREPLAYWDPSGAGYVLTAVSLLRSFENEPSDYLIIPAAMGSSGFVDNMWTAATGPLYVDMVERTKTVLARYPGSTIRAVFWHGGESEWIEAPDGYNDDYPEQMAAMVAQLRADLPMEGVPFLMGGLVPEWAAWHEPNPDDVLPQVAEAIGACYVSAEGLVPLADGVHFELGSQQTLGRRYFAAVHEGCPTAAPAEPPTALR